MPDREVRSRTVSTNGVDLHLLEAGREGPVVLLAHGFPELAYSWRHQLPALAAAGYRAVAPDQRGYGRSSRPEALEDYDIHHLVGDLVGVLDDLEVSQAVVVGHDWASMVASHLALLHPERLRGLVNMSVPHLSRGDTAPMTALRNAVGDMFFYILYFEPAPPTPSSPPIPPGRCAACWPARCCEPRRRPTWPCSPTTGGGSSTGCLSPTACRAGCRPPSLTTTSRSSAAGFTGGLNWYRNMDRNWETTAELAEGHARCRRCSWAAPSTRSCSCRRPLPPTALLDHRGDVVVPGAGHWVQQEAPDEVNAALIGFLGDVHPDGT